VGEIAGRRGGRLGPCCSKRGIFLDGKGEQPLGEDQHKTLGGGDGEMILKNQVREKR